MGKPSRYTDGPLPEDVARAKKPEPQARPARQAFGLGPFANDAWAAYDFGRQLRESMLGINPLFTSASRGDEEEDPF